jgi:hypothetical protein
MTPFVNAVNLVLPIFVKPGCFFRKSYAARARFNATCVKDHYTADIGKIQHFERICFW